MLAANVSLPTIKNFLGHESIQSTMVYTRVTVEEIDEALAGCWRMVPDEVELAEGPEAKKESDLVWRAKQMHKMLSE